MAVTEYTFSEFSIVVNTFPVDPVILEKDFC